MVSTLTGQTRISYRAERLPRVDSQAISGMLDKRSFCHDVFFLPRSHEDAKKNM
jgi:hypothetical protein